MNDQLQKQIEKTIKKSFWNLIKSDLKSEPQNFNHLIILIEEIRNKIKSFTPNRIDIKNELDEVLDDSFLNHLFIEKSLDPSHFLKLIMFLINKIKSYAAPYLDEEIYIWEEDVLEILHNEIIYADFIPYFFEKIYYFLEIIETDIENYIKKKTT